MATLSEVLSPNPNNKRV